MLELNKIYNMDCLEGIRMIDDKSIDLVVTDPPYWHHKSPGKPYSERPQYNSVSKFAMSDLYRYDSNMIGGMSDFDDSCICNLLDALKPKLKIFNAYFFCSESQVPYYCLWADRNALMFSILVWEKPLSIINKNRFSQNLEYIVRIYDYGTALNRIDDNRCYNRVLHEDVISGRNKIHPTEKPLGVMKRFIELSSKDGNVVLDPFIGSGTTAVACIEMNRNFIGIEFDGEYYKIAEKRIREAYETATNKLF